MTVHVAVVGYGYWGSKHARVLSHLGDATVTIVDRDSGRRAEASSVAPWARVVPDLASVLDTVDAVVVATPPETHAPIALTALRAGRHVLVEKPLATNIEDCSALIVQAEAAGAVLMVGHTFEYNPAVWKLKELIHDGELGELRYIDSARLNLGLYQQDVNVVWDLAPHDISITNHILGRAPVAVSTWANCHGNAVREDVAYLQLQYEEPDLRAYIHVSWLDPCKVRRVTVVGTEKMAVYNDVALNERIRIYDVGVTPKDDAESMHTVPVDYRYGDIVSPYIPMNEPLAVQDAHFLDCVRTGRRPHSDGASGLEVVRVLEAANRAMRLGTEVAVERPASTVPSSIPVMTVPANGDARTGAGV